MRRSLYKFVLKLIQKLELTHEPNKADLLYKFTQAYGRIAWQHQNSPKKPHTNVKSINEGDTCKNSPYEFHITNCNLYRYSNCDINNAIL
jgi:hypothetical protein